jgi:hypothetical protein
MRENESENREVSRIDITSGMLDPQVRLRPSETREGASDNILELIKGIEGHFEAERV